MHLFKLLRPTHWLKNSIVLAPLFFEGDFDLPSLWVGVGGVIGFSMLSSLIYIFNDWRDLEADKSHVKKRKRPLASGKVTIKQASLVSLLLIFMLLGLLHLFEFGLVPVALLVIYLSINIAYSLGLKKVPVLEMFLVASGFLIRLTFGALILGIDISNWILVCTGQLSFLLILGKRRGDLIQGNDSNFKRDVLEFYNLEYLNNLIAILSSCIITTYLLFCASPYAVNKFGEEVVVTSIFVVLGVFLYLQSIFVNSEGDDPVRFLISNKVMQLIIFCWLANFYFLV